MPSPLRYIPEEAMRWIDSAGRRYAIVEITIRCIQGRYLLTPSSEVTSLILGVIGRAQALLDFPLFGYAYLSNHGSLLVGVRSPEHLSAIMEYIHGNVAREVGREEYHDWKDKFWARRGRAILVWSDEELEDRLKYLLSNSTKEHLVKHPTRWPGAHCARALCHGKNDVGLWLDRTNLNRLRRKAKGNERVPEKDVTHHYELKLSKLPCWDRLSDEEHRDKIKELCAEIAKSAAEEREKTGGAVLGVKAILAQDPHTRPEHVADSPAPLVHCHDPAQKRRFREAYRAFVAAYREAFAALRAGLVGFAFPDGGIPPGCRYCEAALDTG